MNDPAIKEVLMAEVFTDWRSWAGKQEVINENFILVSHSTLWVWTWKKLVENVWIKINRNKSMAMLYCAFTGCLVQKQKTLVQTAGVNFSFTNPSDYRLGRNKQRSHAWTAPDCLENSLTEKDLLSWWTASWLWAMCLAEKMADSILSCIRKSFARQLKEVILPLYSDVERTMWSVWSTSCLPREIRENTGANPTKWATKVIKTLEHQAYESLREAGPFILAERRLRGILPMYLNKLYKVQITDGRKLIKWVQTLECWALKRQMSRGTIYN